MSRPSPSHPSYPSHPYYAQQTSAVSGSNTNAYQYSSNPEYPPQTTYSVAQQPLQHYQQQSQQGYSPSASFDSTAIPSSSYSQPQSQLQPQLGQYYYPPQSSTQYLNSPQAQPVYNHSPQHQPPYQQHYSPHPTVSPIPHLPPSFVAQTSPPQSYATVIPSQIYPQPTSHHGPSETPTNLVDPAAVPSPLKVRLRVPPSQQSSTPADPPMSSSRTTRHSAATILPPRVASRRSQAQLSYREDDEEDDFEDDEEDADGEEDDYVEANHGRKISPVKQEWNPTPTRPQRSHKAPDRFGDGDDFSNPSPEAKSSSRSKKKIIDPDSDENGQAEAAPPPRLPFPSTRSTRNSVSSIHAPPPPPTGPSLTNGRSSRTRRAAQAARQRNSSADGEDFEPTEDSQSEGPSSDPLGNYEEDEEADDLESFVEDSPKRRPTRSSGRATRSAPSRRSTRSAAKRHDDESDDEYGGGRRNLRARTSRPNYHIPTVDDLSKEISMAEAIAAVSRPGGRPGARGAANGVRFGAAGSAPGLPWHMKGRDLAQAMGDPDTSDSDDFATPLKSGAAGPSLSNTTAGPGLSNTTAVARTGAGGPSDVPNFGRINPKSNMADADPLGVDMNVTFDNVGGLDDHINQLKEMVALPLLYPELFQQFGITPPRGVLFHGPPGTGKTLLARALAASCSTGNTKISFFMRKGADVLSKWVGEAERQLRMLFEEARASQPSIIFFDEIDGLAPVRSSKQDQIHASLVSTLLALMDGMDGRGQVIVIGATNRPDAVDPALRRPGRFDREFYFPLPNRAARKKIIGINTRKWEPALADEFLDKLAVLTKGYGGADLRALCTEAALNAIQRRYPQIYKTADRLQLETGSIHVQAKDFMMSIKKIVPSSARSTSSAAIQLPQHLLPLLSAPLERLKNAIDHVLPPKKHRTALEEAEYEDEDGDSFEKHMMLQSLDKLRTFRPRILVHGEPGMGQASLGPAVLHHLEGFHVQSFDLGTLMGDSTRSVEAAVVQLFVEAKRHQPSVIFVPSLSQWASTISETARSTVRALLDGIPPSDPILLLGMADGPVDDLPADVREWFGFAPENKIELIPSTPSERAAYFLDLIESVRKPPTDFPDAVPRKKRVLEILPLAAPLPPRQPTEAELAREEEKDQAARNMMILSFTALLQEFAKRFRKVVITVKEDALGYERFLAEQAAQPATADPAAATVVEDALVSASLVNGLADEQLPLSTDGAPIAGPSSTALPAAAAAAPPSPATWHAYPIDIDVMHMKLVKHKYYTPSDVLADVAKIESNAERVGNSDTQTKIAEMAANARLHVAGFDPKWTPEFERYALRMKEKKAEKQVRKRKVAESQLHGQVVNGDGGMDGVDNASSANGNGNVVDQDAGNGGLKRVRSVEGEAEDNSQGREKRSRDENMDVDGIPTSSDTAGPSTLPEPTTAISNLGTKTSTSTSTSTIPPPRESYPPFIIPSTLDHFTTELRDQSSQLNIEQLEQLRASLFDMIWRSRSEWDRTKVVDQMRKALLGFVAGVRKWKEAGGWGV